MAKQFKIVLEITVDQDPFAGFGHTAESWVNLITQGLMRQSHYHPEFKVIESGIKEP